MKIALSHSKESSNAGAVYDMIMELLTAILSNLAIAKSRLYKNFRASFEYVLSGAKGSFLKKSFLNSYDKNAFSLLKTYVLSKLTSSDPPLATAFLLEAVYEVLSRHPKLLIDSADFVVFHVFLLIA